MKKEIKLSKIGYYNLEQVASDLNTTVKDLKIVGLRVNHNTQDFTVSFECAEKKPVNDDKKDDSETTGKQTGADDSDTQTTKTSGVDQNKGE